MTNSNENDTFIALKVVEYVRADGLDSLAAAKVAVAKLRLEMGLVSRIKWFDGIGEYRIDWGPGYRVYLLKDGETLIVLLGGGTKRRQQRDIDAALALAAEYRARKGGGPV